MKSRLEEKVSSLRANAMTFNHDGIAFSLSVPDSQDVKDTFVTMATTIADQEDQLAALQRTIVTMAEESAKAQADLVSWANGCMEELKKQNIALESKFIDTENQIKNFSYNIQGFVDGEDGEKVTTKTSSLVKTFDVKVGLRTSFDKPTLTKPDDDVRRTSFKTEGADLLRPSSDIQAVPTYSVSSEAPVAGAKRLSRGPFDFKNKDPSARKIFYHSIPKYRFPVLPKARWRWAIRKVLKQVRTKSLKISVTKSRIAKGSTISDRLDRMESEIFRIPEDLRNYVENRSRRINDHIEGEVRVLSGRLKTQNEDTISLCSSLETQLLDVGGVCAGLEKKLLKFSTGVESQLQSQGSTVREDLSRLSRRLQESQSAYWASIRKRISDLKDQMQTMQLKANMLAEELNIDVDQRSVSQDTTDVGKQLSELLKIDTKLRNARQEKANLSTSASSISSLLRALKNEIAGHKSDPDDNSAMDSDWKELLVTCNEMEGGLQDIIRALASMDVFWKQHDDSMADRWAALASYVEISQSESRDSAVPRSFDGSAAIGPSIESMMSVSRENFKGLIEEELRPLQSRLQGVDEQVSELNHKLQSGAQQSNSQTIDSSAASPRGPRDLSTTSLDGLDRRLKPLITDIVNASLKSINGANMMRHTQPVETDKGMFSDDDEPFEDEFVEEQETAVTAHEEENKGIATIAGVDLEILLKRSKPSVFEEAEDDAHSRNGSVSSNDEILTEGSRVKVVGGDHVGKQGVVIKYGVGSAHQDHPNNGTTEAAVGDSAAAGIIYHVLLDDGGGQSSAAGAAAAGVSTGGKASAASKTLSKSGSSALPHTSSTGGSKATGPSNNRQQPVPKKTSSKAAEAITSSSSQQSAATTTTATATATERSSELTPVVDLSVSTGNANNSAVDISTASRSNHRRPSSESQTGLDTDLLPSSPSDRGSGFNARHVVEKLKKDIKALKISNAASVTTVRDEVGKMGKTLDAVLQEKAGMSIVQELLLRKADVKDLHEKADAEALALVEKTLHGVLAELADLRHRQDSDQRALREELAGYSGGGAVVDRDRGAGLENGETTSTILTRGMCVGCGRAASAHRTPEYRPISPSLLPQFVAPQPGLDIFHSGFKIASRNIASPLKSLRVATAGSCLHPPSSLRFGLDGVEEGERNGLEPSGDSAGAGDGGAMVSPDVPTKGVFLKAVRHAQGRDDGLLLRPIRKKGFPGRKSLRAETAFAPERFDLPREFSKSLNAALVGNSITPAQRGAPATTTSASSIATPSLPSIPSIQMPVPLMVTEVPAGDSFAMSDCD